MPPSGAPAALDALNGLKGIWLSPAGRAAISVDAVAAYLYTYPRVLADDWRWVQTMMALLGYDRRTYIESTSDVTTYQLS